MTPIRCREATETDAILAGMNVAAPDGVATEFMYMSGGVQTVHATRGVPGQRGKDVTMHIVVDRGAAEALQSQLESINGRSGDRAYFDFNHDDRDASFWPARFSWRDEPPGVYVSGEWSDGGRKAIAGRAYRSFSPVFHVDDKVDPARVRANADARPNMGGLVNNPAFKSNLPLWAKQAGANQQNNKTMRKTKEELAKLQAEKEKLEQEIHAAENQAQISQEDAEAVLAKKHEVDQIDLVLEANKALDENDALKQVILATAKREADVAVQAAIKRGAIPPKDDALIANWTKKCVEDPTNIDLLNKIQGNMLIGSSLRTGVRPTISINAATITREDGRAVLGKMAEVHRRQLAPDVTYSDRPKAARELAQMYAKEILPRLKDGDDIPLAGANSLGTLAQTLTAIRTLELLTLTFPLLGSIMTDFSDQIVSYNDTLNSRFVGIPSVQTFNTTTGWPTDSDATTTDVAITYNQFKGVPVKFLAHELAGTVRRLFDEIAPAQAYALGKDIVDYVYALITSAFTNTTTAAGLGTFGRSTVVDIGGILDDAANPDMGRFLLLARPYYSALSKDNTIIQLATFQRASLIEQGMSPTTLQDVEGFRVIKAVNLPSTAIGANTLKGFGASKSALALATRLSADYVNAIPGAGNGNLTVVTTPGGFSANLVQFVSHTGAYAAQRLEVIYGASRGQVAAGALLTDV